MYHRDHREKIGAKSFERERLRGADRPVPAGLQRKQRRTNSIPPLRTLWSLCSLWQKKRPGRPEPLHFGTGPRTAPARSYACTVGGAKSFERERVVSASATGGPDGYARAVSMRRGVNSAGKGRETGTAVARSDNIVVGRSAPASGTARAVAGERVPAAAGRTALISRYAQRAQNSKAYPPPNIR